MNFLKTFIVDITLWLTVPSEIDEQEEETVYSSFYVTAKYRTTIIKYRK
jgi:hypothetical protein